MKREVQEREEKLGGKMGMGNLTCASIAIGGGGGGKGGKRMWVK